MTYINKKRYTKIQPTGPSTQSKWKYIDAKSNHQPKKRWNKSVVVYCSCRLWRYSWM